MLRLSRLKGQVIVATASNGERIEFVVCDVRGNRVQIGVDAEAQVKILRGELDRPEQYESGAA